MSKIPKVALIYDRVNTPHGGAEQVLLALHHVFPEAPLYTSVYDLVGAAWAEAFQVRPSFLQQIPWAKKFHRIFAAVMPLAFESFNLDEFDLIISITSAEAKGVLTKPHQLHLCYLLTPTRYLWSHAEEYEAHWLTGWLRKLVFAYLRWWDEVAHWRPDHYLAISNLVAARCQQFYQQKVVEVIYPPVAPEFLTTALNSTKPLNLPNLLNFDEPFYLVVSRLVPYKRIDLVIQAAQRANRNLVIIGDGPELANLQQLVEEPATPTQAKVQFRQAVHSDEVIAYYSTCTALIAPAEEDFGINILEAQSLGKPVIVHRRSGAAELCKEGETAVFLTAPSVNEIVAAMTQLEQQSWDANLIRQRVSQYQVTQFQQRFQATVGKLWQAFSQERKV